MVKMKDVAAKAGVSVATVSNVFTGRHFVSPDVKEKVLKAVEDLDYHFCSSCVSGTVDGS